MLRLAQREQSASRAGRWRLVLVVLPVCLAAVMAPRVYSEMFGWSQLATEIGGYQKLPLSDGSTVELNTASKVVYRFGSRLREVYLVAGETRFRVAHDTTRPFVVLAGDTVVRAVGTAFTLRRREGGKVDVLVSQGVVTVSHQLHGDPVLELLHGRAVPLEGGATIEAGRMVTDDGGQFATVEMSPSQIEAHDSWRINMLIFNEMPLRDIAAEFNRYNRRQLEFDPSIDGIRIGGRYRCNDVDDFLQRLAKLTEIHVTEVRDDSGKVRALRISDSRF